MKPLFKVLFFILTVVVLSQCEKDEPNPQVKIPDNNFVNALIELGVDTDGDGKISLAEAEVIISLDVREDSISDMTGIEKFVNLDTLRCYNNKLTTLDVSNNTALIHLECGGNPLTTLDISKNIALELLGLQDMPTLHIVCVWETPFPPFGIRITVWSSYSPNIYFTTDCSK